MTAHLLEVKNLSIGYPANGAGGREVVRNISFSVDRGLTLGIIGESGAGKTTVARALGGLTDQTAKISGQIVFDGQDILALDEKALCRIRGSGMGFIFQDPVGSLDPSMPVIKQVEEAFRLHHGNDKAKSRDLARNVLKEVGMDANLLEKAPFAHQLSGGLCQRAVIAAALIAGPSLLVADEPTSALDTTIQAQIADLLKQEQSSRGLGMIFISHDLALVSKFADEILVMHEGEAVEQGTASRVLESPSHHYTKELVRAWTGE